MDPERVVELEQITDRPFLRSAKACSNGLISGTASRAKLKPPCIASELLVSAALRLSWPPMRKGINVGEAASSCMEAAEVLEAAAQRIRQVAENLDSKILQESSQKHHEQTNVTSMSDFTVFQDVKLTVDGCEMWAPASVLAAASPVLKAMMSSAMLEDRTRNIDMVGVTSGAVEAWLSFITSGVLQAEEDILADVATLAEEYDMPELLTITVCRMGQSVKPGNAAVFLRTLRMLPQSADIVNVCAKLSEAARVDQIADALAPVPAGKSCLRRRTKKRQKIEAAAGHKDST